MSYRQGFQAGSDLQRIVNDFKTKMKREVVALHQSLDRQINFWNTEADRLRQQHSAATSTNFNPTPEQQPAPDELADEFSRETMTPAQMLEKCNELGPDFGAWVEKMATQSDTISS